MGDRLTLGHPWEARAGQPDEFSNNNVVHVSYACQGSTASLLEIGYHASRSDILAALSKDADFTYVHWNAEGVNQLERIMNGQIIWSVDIFESNEWPPQVFHQSPLFDLFRMTDNACAAPMALVDLVTGARLETNFIEGVSRGFIFSYFPFQSKSK